MTPPVSRDLLTALPKAELHCHLDGSVRAATLLELGREYGVPMPAASAAALADYMIVRNARSLEDYLSRFSITLSVMQTSDALERIAAELVEDAARDGVRYIEIRYSPLLNVAGGLTFEEAVDAPLRGIERAGQETGTLGRLIICALRQLSPETSLEMARLAVAYLDRGVVGFDLAGAEEGNPAIRHSAAFSYARDHDLAVTVHAGEGAGADSVRQAVHGCSADRIGHGTRLFEDPALTQYVNDRRIALEICLTSNVQTRAVTTYEDHPLRRYFDRGMNVTLNTDNRLMSGTTLTDEYVHAAQRLGFDFDELSALAVNGFASAFLPWEERERMLAAVHRDIGVLREQR